MICDLRFTIYEVVARRETVETVFGFAPATGLKPGANERGIV